MRAMRATVQDTRHVGVPEMSQAPHGMGTPILDERKSPYTRGLSGANVRKLNRALNEVKKLKARIRELQQHNAMAGTQGDTADTGFVLDSGASMHILKR